MFKFLPGVKAFGFEPSLTSQTVTSLLLAHIGRRWTRPVAPGIREATDREYNQCAEVLISRLASSTCTGDGESFGGSASLFLATHNRDSVAIACAPRFRP
eukprot:4207637-Pleurochrysis_carterae.AAC.3